MPDTARTRLADSVLYLCTDARTRQGDLPEFLDTVLAGGVDIVQLRDKGIEAAEELAYLEVFADACARHGKLLAVNDRADVAHAAAADVLHLGQGDLPVPAARAILGEDVLIGRSTHSEAEAGAAAVQEGVDYFCTGPCWPTPTKPGRPPPASTWSGTRPPSVPTAPGSPSAASTSATWTRYWRRAPGGSSWSGRSRTPTTRVPRRRSSRSGCARCDPLRPARRACPRPAAPPPAVWPVLPVRPSKGWTTSRQSGQISRIRLGDRPPLANLRVWP